MVGGASGLVVGAGIGGSGGFTWECASEYVTGHSADGFMFDGAEFGAVCGATYGAATGALNTMEDLYYCDGGDGDVCSA